MGRQVERIASVDLPAVHVVVRAQHGDEIAFERLIGERLDAILRLATAIIGDEADARDAIQEACLSAWRSLPTLRDPERFDAWLGRIVTNSCRMTLRGRRRRQVREVAVMTLDDETRRDALDRDSESPVERFHELEAMNRAFERLDADQRIVVALHHLEGRPVAEIAALTGVSLATAKWRLHVARGALAAALEADR